MSCWSVNASHKLAFVHNFCLVSSRYVKIQPSLIKKLAATALLLTSAAMSSQVYADSMSALIAQKSSQSAIPQPRFSENATVQPPVQTVSSISASSRYPEVKRQTPMVTPAFLSGNYDNVSREYLPLLGRAEVHSSTAAREVISTARAMALNERTIIKGGCWDYLNAVFNRASVNRNTVHKGGYAQGPYANSGDIEVGDWLYYINHGYNDIEHSGLFVGWVDESAKQALILSYAGENRREPARYRVYDLSHVYNIIRPT